MKKVVTIYLMLSISALWSIETNAQSSSATNNYVLGNFLGWTPNPGVGQLPFCIGPGVPPANQLMTLMPGGNFGIADNASCRLTPTAFLHAVGGYNRVAD
jgi:hypothetical protein